MRWLNSAWLDHRRDLRAIRLVVLGVLVCRSRLHAHRRAVRVPHPKARAAPSGPGRRPVEELGPHRGLDPHWCADIPLRDRTQMLTFSRVQLRLSSSSSQAPVSLEFVNCHLTYGPLPRFNQKTAFFNLKLQAFFVLRN